MHTSPIAHALSSVVIGPERTFGNLVMFPLLRSPQRGAGQSGWYDVLEDSIASGSVEVTEVSEQGSVPELRVLNRGARPTLIVDGEELVGAKQNRIVNLTILVAAQSKLTIPVSCVEAGRWRARSRSFAAAPRTQYASGRAKRMAQVTESLRVCGAYYSNQAEVWSDIAQKAAKLSASSPTGAMAAIFEDHAPAIDSAVSGMEPVEGQIGAVFAVGTRVIGFDLFDSEATLRKLLPKLVRSAAVEALDQDPARQGPARESSMLRARCEQFLAAVSGASAHSAPAAGLGEDVRLTAQGLTGAALVVEQQVVDLSAFAV